ncbi:MAG: hypothetical protein AB1411_14885 [Nitrospirota bacterium]
MNDLVLQAEETGGKRVPDLSCEDVMRALKAISAHRALVSA